MTTWVFAETNAAAGGAPTRATRELLAGARRLGDEIGDEVVAFGLAEALTPVAGELGRFGASSIIAVAGSAGRVAAGPVVAAVAALVGAGRPCDLILLPTSHEGREVAGRLAARLGRPLIVNATSLVAGADGGTGDGTADGTGVDIAVESSILGGSTVVRTAFRGPRPWLASFKVGAFEQTAFPAGVAPAVELVDAPADVVAAAPVVAAHHAPDRADGPSLDEASVVVAGGRGLGSAEAFGRLEELAALLGGAVGATRAAVDAGWVAHTCQVGQTGRTVAPAVYLAFGLSGAAQHLVGMCGSQHVIAVNRDRSAPIVANADLTVVGDASAVLDRLIAALRERSAAS